MNVKKLNKMELTKTDKIILRAGIGNVSAMFFIFFISLMGAFLFGDEVSSTSIAIAVFSFLLLLFYLYYSNLLCKVIINKNELIVVTPLFSKTYLASNKFGIKLIKSDFNKIITIKVGVSKFLKRNFILIAARTNLGDFDETYEALNEMLDEWYTLDGQSG